MARAAEAPKDLSADDADDDVDADDAGGDADDGDLVALDKVDRDQDADEE